MRPLAGLRVISIEQFGAAPYGSMFLADLGADVIKVENVAIGGDPARKTGPYLLGDNDSEYFQTWNLNKKSVTLDLRAEDGKAALLRLIASAEVVMNNLRGDLPTKLGIDYGALSEVKRSLVCVHVSAYGRDNERTAWPGYDYLMQAESGLMALTGEPGTPPTRIGAPSMIDHTTGLTATVGLLAALLHARKTGEGCDVDVALFDAALHQLGYAATWYLNERYVPERQSRSAHFSLAPVQTLPTSDGWVFVMCLTEKFWLALLEVIKRPDMAGDPRFATAKARSENRDALTAELDRSFRQQPSAHWMGVLGGLLPIAPVHDLASALESPFVTGRMVASVPHPARPDMRMLANPIRINGKRMPQRAGPAAGADNACLLSKEEKTGA